MAWFKYLKTQTATSYTYPFTKRSLSKFTPKDSLVAGTWMAVDVAGLEINTYVDSNLVEQIDDSSYIVVYEDPIAADTSTTVPCQTVISGDTLYFKIPVDHVKDAEISQTYSIYYNSPGLRYIAPLDVSSFYVNESSKPYAANIASVDVTSFEVDLNGSTYHNFSFINPSEDWESGSASKPGAKAYLTFTGPNLELYGNVGPDCGRARIRITSYANTATPYTTVPVDWTIVDFYNRQASSNTLVYSVSDLPTSEASLELEVISERNTLSSANNVQITSYQFSPSFDIEVGSEQIYNAAPYATVNQYGSAQFFGGSSAFGETIGPTGPTGPQGDDGHLITQDTPPDGAINGDQWLDTNSGRQYAYYNGSWFEVGAAFQGPVGPSGTGYKNALINGCLRVWQRGTGPWTTTGSYTADRWAYQSSGSTFSASRQSFSPGDISGNEAPYYLRTAVTSVAGSSNFVQVVQRIEDVRTFAGQTVTFSFWAKANAANLKIGVEFFQNFGTGGSTSVTSIGSQPITLTTSWKRYSGTVTIPSVAGKTIGTDSRLVFILWFDSGVDYGSRSTINQQSGTFDVWGMQVEPGSPVSSFDMRPYAAELALCQRYYYRTTSTGSYSAFAMGWCASGTQAIGMVSFPVTMRIAPTSVEVTASATDYALWGPFGSVVVCNAVPAISLSNNAQCMVSFSVASGITAGQATGMYANNNSTAYLGFNAEF